VTGGLSMYVSREAAEAVLGLCRALEVDPTCLLGGATKDPRNFNLFLEAVRARSVHHEWRRMGGTGGIARGVT
jgi:hypothetical protein